MEAEIHEVKNLMPSYSSKDEDPRGTGVAPVSAGGLTLPERLLTYQRNIIPMACLGFL